MSSFPLVPLGELLTSAPDPHGVDPDGKYPIAGIYGFGRGMIRRPPVIGREMAANQLFRIRAGQFIYSRLKSFEGAYAIVSPEADGYFVSNEFPTFDLHREQLEPGYLGWYFKQERVWQQLANDGKGIGARRERLHPRRLLDHAIPLPPIEQQRRIVAKLDSAAVQLRTMRQATDAARTELNATMEAAFRKVIAGAPRVAMTDIAPLVRRPIAVDPDGSYPELGVRSFGKGTFRKPTLSGIEVGNKRLFEIHEGDLLFNIVFAWEGAVALASAPDHGRLGSHRFLTCVPDPRRATSNFLLYYFLTPEGTQRLGAASPGGAGRNRTLGLKGLESITVPAPSLDAQVWFDELQQKAVDVHVGQSDVAGELDRLIPALLHQIFGSVRPPTCTEEPQRGRLPRDQLSWR
jgi:type I restriction enzyme S subunit